MKMFTTHGMEGSVDSTLEQGEEGLTGVDMIVAVYIFQDVVPDHAVPTVVFLPGTPVTGIVVGTNAGRPVDGSPHFAPQGLGRHVHNRFHPDSALPFDDSHNGSFLRASASLDTGAVPVTRLTANIGFIDLHGSGELLLWLWGGHRPPYPVHQEERGLVRDTALPADLQSTHAFLGRTRPPESMAPKPQRYPRIFHDGANADGELLLTIVTPPQKPLVARAILGLHLSNANAPAVRAGRNVAPALFLHELDRSSLVNAGLWDSFQGFGLGFTGVFDFSFHAIILHNAQSASSKNTNFLDIFCPQVYLLYRYCMSKVFGGI